MTIRDIAIAFGYDVDKASEKKANDSIQALKSTATKLLGAIGIGFSIIGLKNISEEFGGINDQIRDATRGMGDQADIQKTILKAANESRQSYGDMADAVSKLASNTEVFSGVEDAANFAGLMAKHFTAAGKSTAQVAALTKQITTSMNKGQVSSSAMMALFKESPQTLRMMADSLGVTTEALQNMVAKGQVSASTLKKVFQSNAGAIEGRFGELDITISDAMRNIRNQWGQWVAEMDGSLGITKTIAQFMVKGFNRVMAVLRKIQDGFMKLGKKMGGVDKLMKLLTISAGAFMAVMAAQKFMAIVKAIKMMDKALLKVKLKMLAITAVVIIVALLIDDLINFMQGNDSLLGELFKKFGIDGDAVRETIQGILDAVKGLLPFILELGKQIAGFLGNALSQILPLLMNLLNQILPLVMNALNQILPLLMNGLNQILSLLMNALNQILPLVMNALNQIIPLVLQIITAVLPVIIELIAAILPLMMEIIKTRIEVMLEIINALLPVVIELIAVLLPMVTEIINTVLPIVISLIKALLPMVMQIINTVLPIVISLIKALLPIVLQIIKGVLPVLMELLKALMPVIALVAKLLGNVLGAAFEGLMPIVNAVMGIFQGLIDFITGVFTGDWGKAWNAVVSIFKNIFNGLAAIFKLPINIIIAGINTFLGGLNGLKIPDWVPGLGGKGINIPLIPKLAKGTEMTPDTFIAGEEGPELVAGAKGRKVFTNAATGDIFQTLKDISLMGATPRPETVASAISSVENKSIVQNNQFTNQFYGDRAGQQKSAAAMEKSADDATGLLARGLAYAR